LPADLKRYLTGSELADPEQMKTEEGESLKDFIRKEVDHTMTTLGALDVGGRQSDL
jgi:hypothetical protein